MESFHGETMGRRLTNTEFMLGHFTFFHDMQVTEPWLADHQARWFMERPLEGWTVAEQYDALKEVVAMERLEFVASPADPPGPWKYTESELRGHLERILARMDAARPWPEPVVRGLSPQVWESSYQNVRLVGSIAMSPMAVGGRIHYYNSLVEYGDRTVNALVLLLRSGMEVALVDGWWPGSSIQAVVTRDPDVPAQAVIDGLVDTGFFTAEEFTVVDSDADADTVGPGLWALPSERWFDYPAVRVVARAQMSIAHVDARVRWMHDNVRWDGHQTDVLVVGTRAGVEVTFVGPWWPGGTGVAVVARDPDISPAEVVAALADSGRFAAEEFELLDP